MSSTSTEGHQCVQLLSSELLVGAHYFTSDLARHSQSCELFFDSAAVDLHTVYIKKKKYVLLQQGTPLVCIVSSVIVTPIELKTCDLVHEPGG